MEELVNTKGLETALAKFASERNWERFHTPKNLAMALSGEVGELVEIFQWMTEDQSSAIMRDAAASAHVQQEIADVLIYLVRLASILRVDINAAVNDKLAGNAAKYPADRSGENLPPR